MVFLGDVRERFPGVGWILRELIRLAYGKVERIASALPLDSFLTIGTELTEKGFHVLRKSRPGSLLKCSLFGVLKRLTPF